jgi:glucosamine-phosphate N-acetyltransferase
MNKQLYVRNLLESDYYIGFLELINYFTKDNIQRKTIEQFQAQYNLIKNCNHYIYVIEYKNKIIGSATLIIQPKFHNNFKNAGLIEEVIIDEKFRGQGLGKKIIEFVISEARNKLCYKLVLNSEEKNKDFYTKLGFVDYGIEFKMYL